MKVGLISNFYNFSFQTGLSSPSKPHFTLLQHLSISCPCYLSLFCSTLTCPHLIPRRMSLFHVPATCPHFTFLQHVIISHPCNMSSFPSLQHVTIWIQVLATWFHFLPLQHVPILCPCYLSLFCAPATCSYPMTLEHVPISCLYNIVISHPCKISSFYLPATFPHFMS